MDVQIRPLRREDISRVTQIERQAFPTLWPATPFKRELENRRARYLVALDPRSVEEVRKDREDVLPAPSASGWLLGRFLGGLKACLANGTPGSLVGSENQSIVGFLGLWFMADEAHITSVAVSESWRGRGVGELLIIGCLELAMARSVPVVTLEARVSNHVAQSLYLKYGFEKVGIRKAYYTDNREDATIMTTKPIDTEEYQARFRELKQSYMERYGEVTIRLSEETAVDPPN
jgi:ribosomal-protein-alanine N-acetyltransferase